MQSAEALMEPVKSQKVEIELPLGAQVSPKHTNTSSSDGAAGVLCVAVVAPDQRQLAVAS